MSNIVTKVANEEGLVDRTQNAFLEIANSSMSVVNLIGEIDEASQAQAQGIQQINIAVSEVSGETQKNAAGADELASVMSMFTVNLNSSDKAKALAKKATAFVRENSLETAARVFNNPDGQFSAGKAELYVILNDMKGRILANPKEPQFVGKNDYDRKDSNGRYFVREMIDMAKTRGRGWIYYSWRNHKTGKIAPKKGYVQRVGKTDCYVLIPTLMT
jgi:hypothetical protein